jgi:hypothetical protein
MYHTVWPNSRRLAELITEKCGVWGGAAWAESSPERNKEAFGTFRYLVRVGSPKEYKRDYYKYVEPYNLYRRRRGRHQKKLDPR